MTTLDDLIEQLEVQREKHGGDSEVVLEGYDPEPIRAEDCEETGDYGGADTWIIQ